MAHTSQLFQPSQYSFQPPSKTPNFSAIIQTPISRRGEIRVTSQVYPIWEFEFVLECAEGAERVDNSTYQYLLGFYLAMGGQLSDFLYLDPNDYTISSAEGAQQFGTGDGSTTQFQLTRPIGIGADIVQNLSGTPTVYINGTATTAFTVGSTGIVAFTTAPASGAVLSWTGSWYYRLRFSDESITFDQMMDKLWETKSLKLKSVIL